MGAQIVTFLCLLVNLFCMAMSPNLITATCAIIGAIMYAVALLSA